MLAVRLSRQHRVILATSLSFFLFLFAVAAKWITNCCIALYRSRAYLTDRYPTLSHFPSRVVFLYSE
jgi:hypothetical protein